MTKTTSTEPARRDEPSGWAAVRSRMHRRTALWTMLWRSGRRRLLSMAVLAVLQGAVPTLAILASGLMIGGVSAALDHGAGSAGARRALTGLLLYAGAQLAGAAIGPVLDYQVQLLDGRFSRTIHETVTGATLLAPSVAQLEDPRIAGELAALEDFERADGAGGTASSVRELLRQRSSGIGAFLLLAAFAWWAPLVMLAGWRGLSVGIRRWLDRGMETNASVGATQGRRARYLRSLAVEAGPAKEIRVFGLAAWLVAGYAETYRRALEAIWRGRRLGMRTVLLATSGVLLAHICVLGAIGRAAAGGSVTLAQISVFGQAVLASSALGYLFGVEVPLARSRQGAHQALALEAALTGGRSEPIGRPPRSTGAGPLPVRLHDVRFTYPGRRTPTIRGLDLTIPAGQSVAIVGVNGAGKSTFVKLLCGLYQPDSGRIEVGGDAPVAARSRIAAIFQTFVRYELPLRANVGFGDLAIVDDEHALDRVLTDAGAGGLAARLPAGWDTVLSSAYPGGQDLSGGQWQKVALARALAAVRGGAGLLILDEPAASLDVRAETELFDRLLTATSDVTRILISHRLASVRRADRIVVIADGEVVEDGSHEALMAAGGRYATMFALQAERFAVPAPVDGDPRG